ncbi:MAG: hypothetical protein HYZ39_25780 [Mycolicibacterium cosmeticum]|nr:hypothetical protein [Mycolicibacterium cosmeticum]
MTAAPPRRPALLRGGAVGALTAALALAAHGTASAMFPTGTALAQLLVLAAAVGAVAATTRGGVRTLLTVLAAGQVLGHQLLDIGQHGHVQAHPLTMLAAHLVAVLAGAVLIGAGERLCAALSRTIDAIAGPLSLRVPATTRIYRSEGQPRHSAWLVRASISHRGPPVPA